MALGDSPQAKADGRQIVGKRLSVLSSSSISRKTGAGRFPEWIVDRGPFEVAVLRRLRAIQDRRAATWRDGATSLMTAAMERKLLGRDIRHGAKRVCGGLHCSRVKRRRYRDDDPLERCRRHRQGTGSRGRGLAGLYHRPGRYPLLPAGIRQIAVV